MQMGCSTSKFVLNRNMDNEFVITIKQTGTTLPMELTGADTFTARLVNLSDGETVLNIPFQTTVNTTRVELDGDLITGKIRIIVTEADVNTLTRSVGPEEDRYYLKPNYKLVLECDTLNNGKFIAKVPEVYVE
jgi:hypothetical protein